MRNKLTVIILCIAIFACGVAAGQRIERDEILEEVKLLREYATLLEQENSKIYKILYKHCR
tara:strand:- start:412 stop:594 length:183 start_codon:yes stop_codon:yes gene_type:complete